MKQTIRPTLAFLVLLTVLFGGIYPAILTGIVQSIFPNHSHASLIIGKNGEVLGSELIGQNFTQDKYFWSRLSATSPQAYNAASSSGSNLGANNPALMDAVKARINALKKADPTNNVLIPVDLVTASGSGLDPEISVAAAEYQINRVAKARNLTPDAVRQIVSEYTKERQFGVLGEPRVNVLKLNLALDGKL